MSTAAAATMVAMVGRAFAPRSELSVWEWAEENVVLTTEMGVPKSMAGPYRVAHTPYTRFFLEMVTDPAVDWIVVMKSHQIGFTEAVFMFIRYVVATGYGDLIYVIDSEVEARKLSRKRLRPSLQACEATRVQIPADEDRFGLTFMHLLSCTLELIGANAPGKFAQKSARTIILDELDKMKALLGAESGPWELAGDRLTAHDDGKRIGISTPTVEGGKTYQLFLEGTQHKYLVPCPHCGHRQELVFERLRFDHCRAAQVELELDGEERSEWDFARVLDETFFECEHPECGLPIYEMHKQQMVEAGEWRATNPKALPSQVSMHLSAFYSPFKKMSWGRIAVMFLKARGSVAKMKHFWNSILGLPFARQSTTLSRAHLLKLVGAYYPGTCPVVPDYVSFMADRQMDVYKWSKFAHLADGTIYVVDWGMAATGDELVDAFNDAVEVVPTGERVRPHGGLIDSGYGAKTVYALCVRIGMENSKSRRWLFPSKGRAGLQVRDLVWRTEVHVRGKVLPLYFYKDEEYLGALYKDRIKNFGKPRLWFPAQRPGGAGRADYDDYLEEYCNEDEFEVKNPLGKSIWVWKKRTKGDALGGATLEEGEDDDQPKNDYGDTAKMALAYHDLIATRLG